MLPALTAQRQRVPVRRVALGAASLLLSLGAVATSLGAGGSTTAPGLSDQLAPSTWAMRVPTAWLAAPVPRVRPGDVLDLFAIRAGDRASVIPVAYAVGVVGADADGLVLELREDDAIAIATAHGGGLLIVPLLRSTR